VSAVKDSEKAKGFSLKALSDYLGPHAARMLFSRFDKDSRQGNIVWGKNVREARKSFGSIGSAKAQIVMPKLGHGRRASEADLGEGVILIRMDDLQAVIDAGRGECDWAARFAPVKGLAAATRLPETAKGSRGSRDFGV
jgi:hypothetical protein